MKQSSGATKKTPLRKSLKKGASKSRAPKKATAELPTFPLSPPKDGRALKAAKRYKRNPEGVSWFWGGGEDYEPVSRRKVPRLPNPFPADINSLIKTAIFVSGLAPLVFKVIALWVADRKARKVRVVIGEHEIRIETEGQPSWKEIERICKQARKLTKGNATNDLKVILPRSVDPSIPVEMVKEAGQKKDTPKAKAKGSKASKKGGKK